MRRRTGYSWFTLLMLVAVICQLSAARAAAYDSASLDLDSTLEKQNHSEILFVLSSTPSVSIAECKSQKNINSGTLGKAYCGTHAYAKVRSLREPVLASEELSQPRTPAKLWLLHRALLL